MAYASGKFALALCDYCGQRYPYSTLRKNWQGYMVCPDDYEPKEPQLEPLRYRGDAIALRDPRPDRIEPVSVYVGAPGFTAFQSFGSARGTNDMRPYIEGQPLVARGSVGRVIVSIPETVTLQAPSAAQASVGSSNVQVDVSPAVQLSAAQGAVGTATALTYLAATPTGATVTTSGDYKIAVFNGSGTFTVDSLGSDPTEGSTIDYVVIAGGGGGGSAGGITGLAGGGGGGGGYRAATGQVVTASSYTVTVGGGGSGGSAGGLGVDGSGSSFGVLIVSTGGGGGGGSNLAARNARTGGSGGGGGTGFNTAGSGASGTAGQGSAGGNADYGAGKSYTYGAGGGGGGATAVGGAGSVSGGAGGAGGNGASSTITGSSVSYAGGGGGGGYNVTRGLGSFGGGNGADGYNFSSAGTANTGGGGGGGGALGVSNGGSGVVIIKWRFQ